MANHADDAAIVIRVPKTVGVYLCPVCPIILPNLIPIGIVGCSHIKIAVMNGHTVGPCIICIPEAITVYLYPICKRGTSYATSAPYFGSTSTVIFTCSHIKIAVIYGHAVSPFVICIPEATVSYPGPARIIIFPHLSACGLVDCSRIEVTLIHRHTRCTGVIWWAGGGWIPIRGYINPA